jgi:hypothetical protein
MLILHQFADYFTTLFQLHRLYRVEWDEKMTMHEYAKLLKETIAVYFKTSRNSPREAEETRKTSMQAVARSKFKLFLECRCRASPVHGLSQSVRGGSFCVVNAVGTWRYAWSFVHCWGLFQRPYVFLALCLDIKWTYNEEVAYFFSETSPRISIKFGTVRSLPKRVEWVLFSFWCLSDWNL